MHKIRLHRTALITGLFLISFALPSHAVLFNINNLVTNDQSANAAQITDAGLINAWGLSYAPTGPFWISANGSGTSPLYSVNLPIFYPLWND